MKIKYFVILGINNIMKVLLDVKENHYQFFLELVKSLNYIKVLKEIKGSEKSLLVGDLVESFKNIEDYESGTKKMKTAREFLNGI